jgi:hypothetical protein
VAVFAIAAVLLVDLLLQYLALREGGFRPLVGRNDALGYWDLLKAVATGTALLWAARSSRSKAIGGFGLILFLVALEERFALHARLGEPVARVLRFEEWIPGIQRGGAVRLGEFTFLGLAALVVLGLAWSRRRPVQATVQRARLLLTLLLLAMFFFAGVVDLANGARGWDLEIAEEVGERAVLTLWLGFGLGLASIREWWLLP